MFLVKSKALNELIELEKYILESKYQDKEIKYPLLYVAIAKGSLQHYIENSKVYYQDVPGRVEAKGWLWQADGEVSVQAAAVGYIDIYISGGQITAVCIIGGSIVASVWEAVKREYICIAIWQI